MNGRMFEISFRYFIPKQFVDNMDDFRQWCFENLSEHATVYTRTHMVKPFVSTTDEQDFMMLTMKFGPSSPSMW